MTLGLNELGFDDLVAVALSFGASCMMLSPVGCGSANGTEAGSGGAGGESPPPAMDGSGAGDSGGGSGGDCEEPCPEGEVCSAGTCALECAGGTDQCDRLCVNLQNDPAHCGQCGSECPPEEVCSTGTCALPCGAGETKCGPVCVDIAADTAHCGGCDEACGSDEVCSAGSCEVATGAFLESKSFLNTGSELGYDAAFDADGNSYLAG